MCRVCWCALVATALLVPAAHANIWNFSISLDPDQAGVAGTGMGTGTALYDDVTGDFSWDISFSGLSGNTTVAHFHGPAMPGESASPRVGTDYTTGGGAMEGTLVGSTTISSDFGNELLGNLWYHNIHTSTFGGGEIRGQVMLIPEPATAGTLALGIGAILTAARYRRRRA